MWIRLLGIVIDLVIVVGFNFIWSFVVTLAAGGSIQGLPAFLVFVVEAVIFVGYFAFLWSSRGQSVGMMATGVRVTRTDGSPLTLGRAIGRAIALFVSCLFCALGLIVSAFMVGLSQRKQALHDLVADTVVVHNN